MDPITIGLIATSALGKLGGILGQKKRKPLDMNQLQQMFGAKAISQEQMELFNRAMGSSVGQQLNTSAGQEGQQFQSDIARRAGEAGLGPSGGAAGGADIFAGAAAQSAQNNIQRAQQAKLMESMLPVAQNLVGSRMQAWLGDREAMLGQPTQFQDVMNAVGGLSSNLLADRSAAKSTATPSAAGNQGAAPAPSPSQAPTAPGVVPPIPAGTSPMPSGAPSGAMPSVNPQPLAMPDAFVQGNMPGARQQQLRSMLSGGGGRFARAMSARNRFGAVQSAAGV